MSEGGLHQELRADFNTYDQTVDVVSCWESFTKEFYDEVFTDFYFDRFPTLEVEDDDGKGEVTPDFTIYFNSEYSIVGEIKRTFPDEPKPFKRTLKQVRNYDGCPEIKAADGSRRSSEITDILLLVSSTNANQIGTRISRLKKTSEVPFEENLILLRYWFNQMDTIARYEFERVTQLDDGLRDQQLPDDNSLSGEIGEDGDYGTMIVPPKYFVPEKVQKPICNDEPPGHYLATVLWHKIFPRYLTQEEYLQWKAGTAQKTIPIERTVDDFHEEFNDFLVDGYARRQWIAKSIAFLESANLARQTDENEEKYEVKFRGLVQRGSNAQQEGVEDVEHTRELCDTFISRFIEYSEEEESSSPSSEVGQTSFDQFL